METVIDIYENHDGRFCLTLIDADERTYALFDERGLQGGGYTWEGIVRSLVQMRLPDILPKLDVGAEADNMYIYCQDRQPLEDIAVLVRAAIADHGLLIAAMDNAGEELE